MIVNETSLAGADDPHLQRLARSMGLSDALPRPALIDRIAVEIRVKCHADRAFYGAERKSWARAAEEKRVALTMRAAGGR